MKIKEVCECTGLSDRTIRYYIEENLISPEYTKSYTGRRTFDFSPEDIEALKQISTLRSFDLTVEEIRSIIADPNATPKIVFAAKKRLDASLSHARLKLSTLRKIKSGTPYTMQELAAELSNPKVDLPKPPEPVKCSVRKVFVAGVSLVLDYLFMLSPIIFGVSVFIMMLIHVKPTYPVWNTTALIILFLSFIPSIILLHIRKTKYGKNERLIALLTFACYICIGIAPNCASSTIGHQSVTKDRLNYRAFDPQCEANSNLLFQELFPIDPNFITPTVDEFGITLDWDYAENSQYYYSYQKSSTYDIFAQWPLNEEEYTAEKERVQLLFESENAKQKAASTIPFRLIEGLQYIEITMGKYQCLMILYDFDKPFEATLSAKHYRYWIFAYNDEEHLVRYLHGSKQSNEDMQPYYLSLSW